MQFPLNLHIGCHIKMRFLLIVLILCNITVCAQDFVVTTKRDTLRGRVAIYSFANLDQVQTIVQKKKKEIPATSVIVASIDSQLYHPVLILDGYRMLKLSRPGLVSIYLGRQTPGTPYNIQYLVKKSGASLEISNLRFKKQMTTFLDECGVIKQKIEEDKLKRKDLELIIDEYNKCIESQTHQAFVPSEDPRLEAITAFKTKLEKDSAVSSDAVDILKDLYLKVKEKKEVPNYLTEGLREKLKDFPAYQNDLENLLAKLKE